MKFQMEHALKFLESFGFHFLQIQPLFKIENRLFLMVPRYFAEQFVILQFTTFPIRLAMSGNCPTKNKIQCIAEADVSNPANMKV